MPADGRWLWLGADAVPGWGPASGAGCEGASGAGCEEGCEERALHEAAVRMELGWLSM